jgi:hypothetical protein
VCRWVGGINPRVVEEVWDAQQAFGMSGAEFVPFWKQDIIVVPTATRVSLWRNPLLAVAN